MNNKSSILLSKLFNLNHFSSYKHLSLSNLIKAADYLGVNYKGTYFFEGAYENKHNLTLNTQFIHITGTNGKGSVTQKVSKAIELSGIKTGKYTSPHISSVTERISIDSLPITKERLAYELEEILYYIDKGVFELSFFDTLTLTMLRYFNKEKVEIGVIEVGCGGLLDSTNIINPLLSIITSIGIDHIHVIGSTREEIALNKSGIFKKNTPALVGSDCFNKDLFRQKAKELNCQLEFVDDRQSLDFEEENKETARKALFLLRNLYDKYVFHGRLTDKVIEEGVSSRQSCRFEDVIKVNSQGFILKDNKKQENTLSNMINQGKLSIILDVAHNLHAIEKVIEKVRSQYNTYYIRIIIGVSSNKDVIEIFKKVISFADKVYFISNENERMLSISKLHDYIDYFNEEYLIKHNEETEKEAIITHENVGEVKEMIYKSLNDVKNEKELILICGSFFIMKDARIALGYKDNIDDFEIYDK